MSLIEQNQMEIAAKIVEAPRKTVKIYPTKDAYLSQANPFFPFGKYNTLYVGHTYDSRSESYAEDKALVVFDIPEFNPTDWDNIIEAKLVFYSMLKPRKDIHLLLKQHEDDGWPEYGTTWMGQPLEYDENLARVTFPAAGKSVEIDLLNILKTNGQAYSHYAFSVLEDPSYTSEGNQLNLGSREAVESGKAPVLEITYNWYPANYDVAEMNLNFAVRRWKEKELNARFKVKNGVRADDLETRIHVNNYIEKEDLLVRMRPNPLVYDTRFMIEMTIVQKAERELDTNLHVNGYIGNQDIEVNDFKIKGYKGSEDFSTDLYVRGGGILPIVMSVPLKTENAYLPVTFAVQKHVRGLAEPGFDVSMRVNLYKENSDLETTLTPRYNGEAPILPVALKVKGYKENCDLNHLHIVRPNGEALLETFFHVIGYEEEKDFDVKFRVKGHSELPVILSTAIPAEEKLDVRMKVRPSWLYDFVLLFKTVEGNEDNYAFII